jgi:hypothetical protein
VKAVRPLTRRARALLAVAGWCVVFVAFGEPAALRAQQADSARTGVPKAATDSVRRKATPRAPTASAPGRDPAKTPPVSAGGAFLRSALLPGLGQAALNRPVAGAVFMTAELFSLAMWRKASFDLREARRGAADSLVVNTWQVQNGREVLDSLGRPVPATRATNRWTQGNIASARATFREDWIAAVVFTHLIAGLDAFVAAQLWDLPAQVALRPAPMGGTTLSLGWRFR